MDGSRFDVLSRRLAAGQSRRGLARLLGRLALAAPLPLLGVTESAAKKKHKKHKKQHGGSPPISPPPPPPPPLPPLQFNGFGCIDVGQACRGDSGLCCSGLCAGAPPTADGPDTSRCLAHDTGGCQPGQDSCTTAVACTSSTGWPGQCFTTTGHAGYCAVGNACQACATDADCLGALGPGAACVQCADPGCGIPITTLCKSPSPD